MSGYERGGKHIVNAMVEGNRQAADEKAASRRGKSTINSEDGQLVTIKNPMPTDGCVPDKSPCGCCAACMRRAAARVALEHSNPAERAGVLAKLGLALLVEPGVRGVHTPPVLREGLYEAYEDSTRVNAVVIGYDFEAASVAIPGAAPSTD